MLAKEAKRRMKRGFWQECDRKLAEERSHAKAQGINENKLERYFQEKVEAQIKGEEPDGFYLRVKSPTRSGGSPTGPITRRSPTPRSSATIWSSRSAISMPSSASSGNTSLRSRAGSRGISGASPCFFAPLVL